MGAIQVVGEADQKNMVGEDVGKDSVREAEVSANEGMGKEREPEKKEVGEEPRPEEQKEGHMAEEEQRPDESKDS